MSLRLVTDEERQVIWDEATAAIEKMPAMSSITPKDKVKYQEFLSEYMSNQLDITFNPHVADTLRRNIDSSEAHAIMFDLLVTNHNDLMKDTSDTDDDVVEMWKEDFLNSIKVITLIREGKYSMAVDFNNRLDTAPRDTLMEQLYTEIPDFYIARLIPSGWWDFRGFI